jgi:gluconate 2-dehydrogenase gamma chain
MVISRRDFFLQTLLYGGSTWVALHLPRGAVLAEESNPKVLNEDEWRTVEAITSRIIPSDDDPGAVEANCVNFIDKALAHEDAAMRSLYAHGIAGVDAVARHRFEKSFAELGPDGRDEILATLRAGGPEGWPRAVDSREFFEVIRLHTIYGFLSDPSHGGNRDYVGWQVAGYPGPRHREGGYSRAQMLGEDKIVPIWQNQK